MKKPLPTVTVTLEKIVGGGQTLATMDDGRKLFVWGGLPGETVQVQLTKKRSSMAEGVVVEVIKASLERIAPRDPDSYLSTSPWQIMALETEQHYKSALIEEAFELHDIVLPNAIDIYTDGHDYGYRNKVEFSWYWDKETDQLDLAFYRRGSHGKLAVNGTSLAAEPINQAGLRLRDILRARHAEGRDLKTALIRSNQAGDVIVQLYVKSEVFTVFTDEEIGELQVAGFELIYSNPQSPASVITKRLQQWGVPALQDTILSTPFTYATEGFFQINLPVYEQALRDMQPWVEDKPLVDLYSGVGTIGLTITKHPVTLVELNESAVSEMRRNIINLKREAEATAVLAPSEQVLDKVTGEACVVVDPPRAGLHEEVIQRLLQTKPTRIIYLSCNPVTQARDIARLAEGYGIEWHRGYNFFPHTPHIEHLVILRAR